MSEPSLFEQVITPTTHDLGQFQVRRAIPSRERTMVGPFIFVDQFGPAQLQLGSAMDVRPHPHINLATVTWAGEPDDRGPRDRPFGTLARARARQRSQALWYADLARPA